MSAAMQCGIEHSIGNSLSIRRDQPWPIPARRKIVGESHKMNVPKGIGGHFTEVKIRRNEIHLHAGTAADGVSVALENCD